MDCAEPDADEPARLPTLNGLVAGTVALMTAWANPCPQARLPAPELRRLLARKVVSNLFFLQHHPDACPELRQSLAQAHARWVMLAQGEPALPAGATAQAAEVLH